MESTSSSAGSHHPRLPPGFRFHPTDEELVVHYLKKKAASAPLPVAIIAELDLYKYDPWELPSKASFGEQEWYFFSPRERKYPNGERPNRTATSGYWKATGTDKPILTAHGTRKIGVKKVLVFYGGKPPKGVKTNWIMHEYRLVDNNSSTNKPPGPTLSKKGSLRLDDWVLCRIFKKINSSSSRPIDQKERDEYVEDGYQSHNIPGPGKPSCHGNFYSSGNGPAISSDPMSISLLASSGLSKSDFDPKHIYSWNGTMFSNEQWGAGNDENNPGNSCPAEKNVSFISLLNQQYPQEFHQNLLVNSTGDHGILHQSYQLNSTSQLQ